MTKSPSPTTTSMNLADSPAVREPIQTDAMGNAASGSKTLASRYAGQPGINSGLAAGQPSELRPVVVTPVDRRTIEGSTPGDFRAKPGDTAAASVARATDNGGPRMPMRGQRTGRSYNENANPTFRPYGGGSPDSDAGN
jgi:hypothetical protein